MGSTSFACIEPDVSVTSRTDACWIGTATVASGRASAIASAASAAAKSAAGRWRFQAGTASTSPASVDAPVKRTAKRRRRRRASA